MLVLVAWFYKPSTGEVTHGTKIAQRSQNTQKTVISSNTATKLTFVAIKRTVQAENDNTGTETSQKVEKTKTADFARTSKPNKKNQISVEHYYLKQQCGQAAFTDQLYLQRISKRRRARHSLSKTSQETNKTQTSPKHQYYTQHDGKAELTDHLCLQRILKRQLWKNSRHVILKCKRH